jgi:two-component system, NarL family, sensor histidine kinase DesK
MRMRLLPPYRELTWMPYAWLLYSLPFLAGVFFPGLELWQRAATLVVYVAFLWLYFLAYWIKGRRIYLIAAAMDAIALVFSAWSPAAPVFFIYAAATLGWSLPVREAALAVVVQVGVGVGYGLAMGMPMWFYIPAGLIAALIGAVNIQSAANRRADAKLRLAHDEVEQLAKLAERERIARDLHDVLGHTLSVVVLKSELARKLVAQDPERAAREMADVEQAARAGLADVRTAITGYRSVGLLAEIERVRQTLADANLATTVEMPAALSLSPAQETTLAMALREAATNVIRHAHATSVRIGLHQDSGGHVRLDVEDDGRGGDSPLGYGLTGMRERITALGGELVRQTDRGTRLRISLPSSAGPR